MCCATFRRYGNVKIINIGPLSAFACKWAIPRYLSNRLSYILRSLFSPSHPGSCSLVCRPLLPSLTTHSCLPSFGRLGHNNVFISILIGLLSIHLIRSPPLGFFPGTSLSSTFIVMSSWLLVSVVCQDSDGIVSTLIRI